jgi:hypothetical protein
VHVRARGSQHYSHFQHPLDPAAKAVWEEKPGKSGPFGDKCVGGAKDKKGHQVAVAFYCLDYLF